METSILFGLGFSPKDTVDSGTTRYEISKTHAS